MKGRVKLELFDKNGKLVDKREDDNMMTTAIQNMYTLLAYSQSTVCNWNNNKFFYSANCTGNSTAQKSYRGIGYDLGLLTHLFGTLELFDSEQSEDPTDYVHHGESIVGIGGMHTSYTGTNPYYGNYNTSESGWNDEYNAFTFVYDFPTTQGNGTIASLGLAPYAAKYCGTGTDYIDAANYRTSTAYHVEQHLSRAFLNTPMEPILPAISSGVSNSPICASYDNNFVMFFDRESYEYPSNDVYFGKTGKMIINKFRVPLSTMFLDYNTLMNTSDPTIYAKWDQVEIELKNPLNPTGTNYGFWNYHDGYIYMLFSNSSSWAVNTDMILTKYDVRNGTEEFITITNTTGMPIALNIMTYGGSAMGYCNGKRLFVTCHGEAMFIIDLIDNSNCQRVMWRGTTDACCSINSHQWFACGDDVFFSPISGSDLTSTWMFAVNLVNATAKTIQPSGYYTMVLKTYTVHIPIMELPGMYLCTSTYSTYDSTPIYLYSGCAAGVLKTTKMNLESPVTKTSDLTMKVTYTLTFNNDETESEETT